MATFPVDEVFPLATVDGMATVSKASRAEGPRTRHDIRLMRVKGARGRGRVLVCEVRKGSGTGRDARMGRLQVRLTQTHEGVRAQGTFGPSAAQPAWAVRAVAICTLALSVYGVASGGDLARYLIYGVFAVVLLALAPRVGLFLFARDDWSQRDLECLLGALHEVFDRANTPHVPGGA